MKKVKTNKPIIDGDQLIGKVIKDPFVSTCVSIIDDLPDSHDIKRVMNIKAKISAGDYNFDENLDAVVDALITESRDPAPLSMPVFNS